MDTTRKLRKEIAKMNDKELEEALNSALNLKAKYSVYKAEQEEERKKLVVRRKSAVKRKDDEEEKFLIHQISIADEEIERIAKLERANVDGIKILQSAMRDRIEGRTSKYGNVLGWLSLAASAGLCGTSLFAGYKSDVRGTMKNKTPLAIFDKCLAWINRR